MTFAESSYDECDQREILDYLKRISPVSGIVWGWDAGRYVDWRWGGSTKKLDEHPHWFGNNCRVFRHNGEIGALAISEYGGNDVAVLAPERNPDVFREILTWLLDHWAPKRDGLSFEFSHNEYWLSSILEESGFAEEKNTGNEWEYDLGYPRGEPVVPEGFIVESLSDGGDAMLPGIAEVLKKAFNSKDSVESLVGVLKIHAQNPLYLPELNVYARNHAGMVTAYCRGTVNAENGIAGIDPVCSHPDFSRKGLAKAVVQECFRRQEVIGGKLCYIGSAPMPAPSTYLYRSLKPRRYTTASKWTQVV